MDPGRSVRADLARRKRALVVIAGATLIGIQFGGPRLMNPPVIGDLPAPPPVKRMLRTACYNCHSNETEVRWFDRVAPAYWIVTGDVLRARARLNFSELGEAPTERQTAALLEALDQMRTGAMPPAAYRMVHPEARVGPKALATLERYLESLPPAGPTS